jgi:hypothetical protein
MIKRRIFGAFLILAVAGALGAQTLTGAIEGTVKDEQGGALPGVSVTLIAKTGNRSTVTDATGSYRFPAVEPGTYQVSAELSGFAPRRVNDVVMQIGKTASVDMTLKVGGMSETLEIVGEAPVVDVKSSESNNAVSQDLLFNIPINRNTGTDVMNYTPGVSNDVAFGGDRFSGSALLLDGVDTRDPSGGTAWTFYNYNIIEEVQVGGLGANAEYGSFTGAVVNTITKSGGNRFQGLFDGVYSKDSFASDNISASVKEANPSLADPEKQLKYLDLTGQLSGPIVKDKLFFFASAQRYELNTNPTGPTTLTTEVDPRLNLKLTWLAGRNDTINATLQWDAYNITGRNCFCGASNSTDDLTVNEDAPEYVWGATWRHIFGTHTFGEVKFTGYDGYFDLNPKVNLPGHFDGATGLYSVSNGSHYYADRGRNQINASISHYAEAFGKHDLKFGVEVERSRLRSQYGLVDNITYYDYGGAPYLAYNYGYDISAANHRESVYLQDSWKASSRLTINGGVRWDFIKGIDRKTGDEVYNVKPIAPRIGFAFDLTGDEKTVLKAHYGQYYEGAFVAAFDRALSGQLDRVTYDPAFLPERVEIDRSPNSAYRIADGIKHPRVDQYILGIERALSNDVRIAVTGILRQNKNFIGSVIPSARWTPTTVHEDLHNSDLGVYSWANVDESESDLVITNPDGFVYRDTNDTPIGTARAERKYKGLMTVLSKRFSKRWQAQVSYVVSKTTGTVDNNDSSIFGYNAHFFETPTLALVNSEGPLTFGGPHEFKVLATYQVPKIELNVNGFYRYLSGRTYAAYQRFPSSEINFPPSSAGRQPWIEPLGSRRIEGFSALDLRIGKIFQLSGGTNRFEVYADITNVFNAGTITRVNRRYPSTTVGVAPGETADVAFGAPISITPPRQVTIGARWSF